MKDLYEIRGLSKTELEEYSRTLFDDRHAFNRIVVALAQSGELSDYEKIAEILSYAPIETGDGAVFYAADKYEPKGKKYIDLLVSCCKAERYPESKYISVILGVRYAKSGTELCFWREGADAYLTDRAKADFDFVADCIDCFDKKFASYDILLRVDRVRAVDRLMNKLLNEKYFDKASARGALSGCNELVDTLIELFDVSDAKTRVKLARILLLFKNDHAAGMFIKEKSESDPSKTVREVLSCAKIRARITDPVKFLERLMMTGESITHAEFKEIEKSNCGDEFRAAADKLFFCGEGGGKKITLLYNRGRFYDTADMPVRMRSDSKIYVLHPIEVTHENEEILSLDIDQPFLQIARPIFYPNGQDNYRSYRLDGTMINRNKFDFNMKNSGFTFAADGGEREKTAVISIGEWALAVECGMPKTCDTVDCGVITFYRASDIVKNNKSLFIGSAHPVLATAIPPVVFSELTYAVYRLFDCL